VSDLNTILLSTRVEDAYHEAAKLYEEPWYDAATRTHAQIGFWLTQLSSNGGGKVPKMTRVDGQAYLL
jgi:hypothetical protein